MSGDACAGCTGGCCEDVAVGITGYDAWRIATARRVDLAAFTTVATAEPGERGAFRFGDEYAALLLARSARSEDACIFLEDADLGVRRCGAYASRPVVCRTYPMALCGDVVVRRGDVVCAPDAWDLATISEDIWRRDLERYAFEWEIYDRTVATWNLASNAASGRGLEAFHAFVMHSFAAIDARRGEVETALGHRLSGSDDPAISTFFLDVDRIASATVSGLE